MVQLCLKQRLDHTTTSQRAHTYGEMIQEARFQSMLYDGQSLRIIITKSKVLEGCFRVELSPKGPSSRLVFISEVTRGESVVKGRYDDDGPVKGSGTVPLERTVSGRNGHTVSKHTSDVLQATSWILASSAAATCSASTMTWGLGEVWGLGYTIEIKLGRGGRLVAIVEREQVVLECEEMVVVEVQE